MRLLSFGAIAIGMGIFVFPTGSDSCSIAPPVPVFSTRQRPADLSEFAKGKLGVIEPLYQRRYLIGGYRTLSGKPLSQKEAETLYLGGGPTQVRTDGGAATVWTQVSQKVKGATGPSFLNTYKAKTGDGSFVSYANCLNDAFDSAVATYGKRAAQWGEKDPRLQEWVKAQDQVFANCSGKDAVIPTEPTAGMDSLLAADRRYQIAAAYFYAEDWQKAREAFQRVAQDSSSPWKESAPYLIARTEIREGTLEESADALRRAEQHLQQILDDPAQERWHEASRRLLDYVRLRIDPAPRLQELAAQLTGAQPSPDLAQAAADFLYLYRRESEKGDPALAGSSDLADWMLSFEGHVNDSGPHALEQWKKTRSAAWLIAALAHASDAEALRAARGTDANAPEYEAVTYYGIRAEPDPQRKRSWADEALKQNVTLSTRNRILAERLAVARDWNEFLRFAPRRPEPKLQSFDDREEDIDRPPVSTGTAPLFDADATTILNWNLPLALWEEATRDASLPSNLQLQTAEAAWVRALVLGKDSDAKNLMERVVKLRPSFAAAAHDYLTAPDAGAARFAGIFLLLRTPALISFVEPGAEPGDLTKVSHLGSIGWGFKTGCLPYDPNAPHPVPAFLDEAQRAQNEAEWKQMTAAAPSGGSFLAAGVMTWARSHPDDSRVPEALHLVVQAGRRACRDYAKPADYGRPAFELLHRQYPRSEWAQKTKFWYR